MTSRALRRRLHNGDVDGRSHEHLEATEFDGLNEPLLGNNKSKNGNPEGNTAGDLWENEERKVGFHWAFLFSQLIAQWAQWIASFVIGPVSLIERLLSLTSDAQSGYGNKLLRCSLSPLQEERLRYLKRRLEVPYNGSCLQHQDALKRLWRLAFPDRELPSLKSELWKEMGWQGTDPSTDFRGGGFISLENLIFFAQQYPESFHRLLHKKDGTRAEWEYPFAVAGVNISFMLAQMLDLQSGYPNSSIGIRFLELLEKDEKAFDKLYCVAFKMMDAQWLAKRASYMDFNEVLKSTRTQLERELTLEDVSSVMDLPAYNLLRR